MNKIRLGGLTISDECRELINSILDSGRVSYGPISKQLEEEVAKLHGAKFGILSNSGTSSLQVALHSLKILNNWPDGSEVIVPATTFVATANIVLQNNLKPVFVDVDRDCYDIDVSALEAARSDKTVCLIPVSLFGQTPDLEPLKAFSDKYGLKTILDSCESIGVCHGNDVDLAQWVDIVCFSFYVAHVVIGGVGGMSITNNDQLATLMRSLVNHGRRPSYITIDDKPANLTDRFTFDYPGYSYRITEFESALALSYVHRLDKILQKRYENSCLLFTKLYPFHNQLSLPVQRVDSDHCWMMFPIVIKDQKINKLKLCQHLENAGIETRDMLPLINQPVASFYGLPENTRELFPVSWDLIDNGFYISCSENLTIEDIDMVAQSFASFIKEL